MFIRQMTYLLALAREKHFARAAESCHVTQSTLSAGLKSLERELGMPLVVREERRRDRSNLPGTRNLFDLIELIVQATPDEMRPHAQRHDGGGNGQDRMCALRRPR